MTAALSIAIARASDHLRLAVVPNRSHLAKALRALWRKLK